MFKGKQIDEFVGLKAKSFSYEMFKDEHKKCNEIKRNVVKTTVTHEDLKKLLIWQCQSL
jgi:hypothetical protein